MFNGYLDIKYKNVRKTKTIRNSILWFIDFLRENSKKIFNYIF
jgi:hypothetical protein